MACGDRWRWRRRLPRRLVRPFCCNATNARIAPSFRRRAMAEKPQGESWSNDWNALNQQFWSAWSEAARNAGAAVPGKTPWHEGLEQWSRLFAPKTDAQGEL